MPDQELACRDCGATFVFTEAEQELFRAQGFTHPPKRCKACRAKARHRGAGPRDDRAPRSATQGPGHGGHGAPREASATSAGTGVATTTPPTCAPAPATEARPPRPRGAMHATVCSLCGSATEVPFVPDGVRPVFCLPCLKRQTR